MTDTGNYNVDPGAPQDEEDNNNNSGNDNRQLKLMMESVSFLGSAGLGRNPIANKITEKHVDKLLEISQQDNQLKFQDAKNHRFYSLIYFFGGIGLFIFLTIFLVDKDKELFGDLVKLLIAFVGGIGAGYGINSSRSKSNGNND